MKLLPVVRLLSAFALCAIAVFSPANAETQNEGSLRSILQNRNPGERLAKLEALPPTEKPELRFIILTESLRAAFEAGTAEKARTYAEALLIAAKSFEPKDPKTAAGMQHWRNGGWNYGNAIHDGHAVLGLLALQRNDVAEAKRQLELAATTPGSPQISAVGPDMRLARELLERGERQAVLNYLERCLVFWPAGTRKIAVWKEALNRGDSAELDPFALQIGWKHYVVLAIMTALLAVGFLASLWRLRREPRTFPLVTAGGFALSLLCMALPALSSASLDLQRAYVIGPVLFLMSLASSLLDLIINRARASLVFLLSAGLALLLNILLTGAIG